jgi:sulfur-carrier protein adenylyltransferase/sulfurtransferase
MGDGGVGSAPPARGAAARRAVAAELEGWSGCSPLGRDELGRYRTRHAVAGWRIAADLMGGPVELDVLLTEAFPYDPPRIALARPPPPGTWPHVEEDGALCLLPAEAALDHDRPVAVVERLLVDALDLVEDCLAGRNQAEFEGEAATYWARFAGEAPPRIFSLADPGPPSRRVAVFAGATRFAVGDDPCRLARWLANAGISPRAGQELRPGALLWLDAPLRPREFPRRAKDVLRLARERVPGGQDVLRGLIGERGGRTAVVLGASTGRGPVLVGVVLAPPAAGELVRGFRPGRVPMPVLTHRCFGGLPAKPAVVDRVDGRWAHGRDRDARFGRLASARVAVVGCGSLGAPVALRLATAGVGHLALIDPGRLGWENIGRHPLGAAEVGLNKAEALARRIRAQLPHIGSVEAHAARWEAAPERLETADLVVATTGDWGAEAALDDWHGAGHGPGSVLYGWLEAFACAGHAVTVARGSAPLRAGFEPAGRPRLRATEWPPKAASVAVPGCGVTFAPYGPVELTHVEGLVAEAALDALLEPGPASRHRVWAAHRKVLERSGGRWTAEWAGLIGGEGGRVVELAWPPAAAGAAALAA